MTHFRRSCNCHIYTLMQDLVLKCFGYPVISRFTGNGFEITGWLQRYHLQYRDEPFILYLLTSVCVSAPVAFLWSFALRKRCHKMWSLWMFSKLFYSSTFVFVLSNRDSLFHLFWYDTSVLKSFRSVTLISGICVLNVLENRHYFIRTHAVSWKRSHQKGNWFGCTG